jgi:hypothetical protein
MSTSALIPNIRVEDVPAREAKPFKSVGVIGEVKQREVANGYVQIEVPIAYVRENGSDDTFYARWNVRPEWFTPEFTSRVKSGEVQGSEKVQYDINMSGLTIGLFKGAGISGVLDFSSLPGKRVGFKTKPRKDDPSRLDISFFFAPKQ